MEYIYYDDSPKLINTTKSVVRLGLIQWQMRSLTNLDALDQAEFLLTPFLVTEVILHYFLNFTAPLMADFNHLSEAEAIRELAKHTEAVKLKFQELLFLTTSISSQEACLL
jgi:hypothetical protein